jgi:pyruvate dehydrogenase E2 component (dihydrolipoamide acetyltransferase)
MARPAPASRPGEADDATDRPNVLAFAAQRPAAPAQAGGPLAPAAPSVRRLARELGVDLYQVPGTGPGGRISQDDVKNFTKSVMASLGGGGQRAVATVSGASVALPDFSKWGAVERKPMTGIRRKTSEHLSHAWNTIPHVTQFDKADITSLEQLRKQYRAEVEKAGGNLTVTAIATKVVGAALKAFPQFNASVDPAGEAVVYKKYVHVGIAVDTENGLLVPVIRNVDQKNLIQISIEIQQLAEKAKARKLSLDEMSGGSMSISNLGGIGGTAFTPIVNWPEVAILGISRGAMEPKWSGSAFDPRLMLPLSLSYDHRLVDGADAIRFLRWVVDALENPFALALRG